LTKKYLELRELGANGETRDRVVQEIVNTRFTPDQATISTIKSTQLPLCRQNLGIFRDSKAHDIRMAAIQKTEQFLQKNPSIIPDLTTSLSAILARTLWKTRYCAQSDVFIKEHQTSICLLGYFQQGRKARGGVPKDEEVILSPQTVQRISTPGYRLEIYLHGWI
jgi:hypothetical protein